MHSLPTQCRRLLRKRTLIRALHMVIIGAIFVSVMPPATARAAASPATHAAAASGPRAEGACAAPSRGDDGEKLFLPLLSTSGQVSEAGVDASPSAVAARMLDYQVGKVYTYLYDYEMITESKSRDNEGTNSSDKRHARVNAYVDVTILDKDESGVVEAQLVMRDAFICNSSGDGEELIEDGEDFLAVLATPMRFKQAPDGVMSDIRTVAEVPPFVNNILKGALNFLQATLREDSDSYDVEERGGQGTYNVSYKLEDKDDGLHVTKIVISDDYKELQSAGAPSESLQLKTEIMMVVGTDGVISSVNLTEDHLSADGDQDPQSTGEEGLDGVSVWSTAESTGSMKLESVTDADIQAASLPLAMYEEDDIVGSLDETYSDQNGINIENYDINAELAKIEADPTAPEPFEFALTLYDADPGTDVIDAIGARLAANAANEEVANAYIDILGIIGTPQAQELINGVLGTSSIAAANISATTTMTTETQALLAMLSLDEPTDSTVETLEALSADDASEHQDTAIGVLGAAAHSLADSNPTKSQEIAASLTSQLEAADTEEEVTLYLDAVGNAGDPASLETVRGFFSDTEPSARSGSAISITTFIRAAAFDAVRKMPGNEVEGLLLAPLSDSEEDVVVQQAILNALADRATDPETQLSPAALSSVSAFINAQEGGEEVQAAGADAIQAYRWWRWNKSFGNAYVGVDLPGYMYAASPSHSNPYGGGLYFYGYQRADAHIWQVLNNYTLAKGEIWTQKRGNLQRFGARLSVLGNRIRVQYIRDLPCAATRIGTLLKRRYRVFSVSKTILVWGVLPLTFRASSYAYFQMVYRYTANVCNVLAPTVRGAIIPYVWATASGSAYVTLVAIRGGATLAATLLKTSMPVEVRAWLASGRLNLCIDVDVNTQPLAMRFFLWADHFTKDGAWWQFWKGWSWKRWKEWTVASFNTGTYSYNLWDRCYN